MQDDSEKPEEPGPDGADWEAGDGFPEDAGDGYNNADFHTVVHKQIVNATLETLSTAKLGWEVVEPFLHAAREICRGDFERTGRVEIHGVAEQDGTLAEAEEAYVSVSIADQDDGGEWLSATWWLSDAVLASGDPERVREAVRAIEKSLGKLNAWLAAEAAKGPGEAG